MKFLEKILENVQVVDFQGEKELKIDGISADSRKIKSNFLFVATVGTQVDGHLFVKNAVENGATAVIYSDEIEKSANVTYIKVEDTKAVLAICAENFYDNPSKKMTIVGITGTNGKTTIATTLYRMFLKMGFKSGLISTIANYVGEQKIDATHTTPEAVELSRLFSLMVEQNCQFCFMEVSSHSLMQKRVHAVDFDGAVFTNLTHEHLDYHGNFKNYLNSKKILFDNLKKSAFAITNVDDKNGSVMLQNTVANKYSYSLKTLADYKARVVEAHFDSTFVTINNKELWLQFVGTYNVYNLLAVFAVADLLLSEQQDLIFTFLSTMKSVTGRFDVVKGKGLFAIIDYAHTPDALENILKEINKIKNDAQRIITVVGAGGDRDKTKRPKMATIASFYSSFVILTSDNPRTENPETILDDMEKGLDDKAEFLRITDRRQAIKTATVVAKKNDIILIAGKGHETYQEINKVRHHFDDKEEVKKILEN